MNLEGTKLAGSTLRAKKRRSTLSGVWSLSIRASSLATLLWSISIRAPTPWWRQLCRDKIRISVLGSYWEVWATIAF